jgi:chromosome segregation ATPase
MSAYTRNPENQVISISERAQELKPEANAPKSGPEFDTLLKFPQFFYEIETFCSAVQQLDQELKNEREKNRVLNSKFASESNRFQKAINESHQQIRDLSRQVQHLTSVKSELESTKKIHLEERQHQTNQIQNLRTQIKQEQSRLEMLSLEFSKSKDTYELDLKNSQDKYFRICLQEEKIKHQLHIQVSQSENLKSQLQALTQELNNARMKEHKSVSKNQAQEAKLSELHTEIQKQKQNLQYYQNELGQAKSNLTSMQLDLIQTQKELTSSADREMKLRRDFDLLQSKTKHMVDELTDSHLNFHLIEEKLTKITEDFNKTSIELEKLKMENSALEHNNQKWGLFLLQDFMAHKNREIERVERQLASIPEQHPDRGKVVEILELLKEQRHYLSDILRDIEQSGPGLSG